MAIKMYQAKPINVEDVKLPEGLEALREQLAKNTHEVWAKERMKDGWTFGEERDDTHKKHPCLVPYEALSEEEKHFDRVMVENTLKLIYKFGYKIVSE